VGDDWQGSILRASDIIAEPISWLWRDWLARGKLHILAGVAGTGKTTLAMKIAATVSAGLRWPDGTRAEPANVVIWSGEDDPADTLIPRLECSGADLKRVYFTGPMTREEEKRAFDPAKDLEVLRGLIKSIGGAGLIIFDPVVTLVTSDSHKNSETRRGLQPAVELASEVNAALLGITHFTKASESRSPLDRVAGSLAFGAIARIVLVAATGTPCEEGQPPRRFFMRAKSNLGPDNGGFSYELTKTTMYSRPDIVASIVKWKDQIEGNARNILASVEEKHDAEEISAKQNAEEFLSEILAGGPVPQRDIKAAAEANCHSWRTIERAKAALRVVATRPKIPGPWHWELPSTSENTVQGRQGRQESLSRKVGGVGGVGGVGAKPEPFIGDPDDIIEAEI
jgi:putative DNA primase/helicase